MSSEDSLITAEARAAIGRESEPLTGYPVSDHEIRRFCYAVDDLNPLYTDPDYAAKTEYGGIVAPPLFLTIPFARDVPRSRLNPDGIPRLSSTVIPPLKADRLMWGGLEIEFFQVVRPDDVLTQRTKLVDIYEKQGRSGPLAFTITETSYTNQRGELVALECNTIIAR
jgi:acyl dehydratase